MNLNVLLLNYVHTSTVFEMFVIVTGFMIIGFVIGAGLSFYLDRNEKTYKQGQVDALNGKVNYEKKENEDGEMVWVEKKTWTERKCTSSFNVKAKFMSNGKKT